MHPTSAGQDADAIARFERYLSIDPGNTLLQIDLGDLYHAAGRFAEAKACYESVLGNEPENRVAQSRLGSVALSEHRFEDAEALFRPLYETTASPADTHNLGLAVMYQRRWAEALALFEQAAGTEATGLESQKYITRALHQLGDFDRAIEICKSWLAATGSDEVEGYLALLEGDAGNDPLAAQARARAVLERAPDNPDAAVVVATGHLERQDVEQAQALFERLTRNAPHNPRGWFGCGLVAMMQKRPDDAIESFEKTLSLIPEDAATLVVLGWVHLTKMDGFTAEGIFRRAVKADPKLAEAHGGLAASLAHLFQFDEAQKSIRRARALNKHCFGAGYAMSVISKLKGHDERAEQIFASYLNVRLREDAPLPIEAVAIELSRRAQSSQRTDS